MKMRLVAVLPIAIMLTACNSKEEIKPVTHSFPDSVGHPNTSRPLTDHAKAKEITVMTVSDKSSKPDKDKELKQIRSANKKKYEIEGERWGEGRKSDIGKHPRVPGLKNEKGIPIANWSFDLD